MDGSGIVRGLCAVGGGLVLFALAACGGGDDSPPQATLTVNTVEDVESRDGTLSLREALLVATGELGTADLDEGEQAPIEGEPGGESRDTIVFDQEVFSAGNPGTVVLEGTLPVLSSGFDRIAALLAVVIDGAGGDFPCVDIDSEGNSLQGLILRNCRTAIRLNPGATQNEIGGPGENEGNVISGNTVGIEARGASNVIQGNIIGLDARGSAPLPNEFEGIWLAAGSKDNLIGGPGQGEGNVISGNSLFGVSVEGKGTTGNRIEGNVIGTDAAGIVGIGNKYGVIIQNGARANVVGGDDTDYANVISGNNIGVVLRHEETSDNTVTANYFGLAEDGETPIRNDQDVWEVDGAEGKNRVEENVGLVP